MKWITPAKMPWFIFSYPHFLVQEDLAIYKKAAKSFAKYFAGATLVGLTLNVQIKRLSRRILSLPYSLKLPLRFALFVFPFGFVGKILVT